MRTAALRGATLAPEQSGTGAAPDTVDARRAAAGDQAAFERLYNGHVARVHSLARRMVGPEEADEVTQDVFVRAWQKLGTFKGQAAFGTWLHRVAVNVMLGRRAELAKRRGRTSEGDGLVESLPSRRSHIELHMDFETAIGRLPAGAREVFVLHDVQGFKHQEIAEMLGVSTGTTKAQLHRARMALRRYVDR